MNLPGKLRGCFRALFRKKELDTHMHEEMRSHIEMETQDNIEAGMNPEEARRKAMLDFGVVESIKERCRDERGVRWIETLGQDIRYGARTLRKNPGFTTVAVLTLALGIGANTAIFSVVNAVLLRPLPYPEPRQLVQLRMDWSGSPSTEIGSAAFFEVKAQSQSLALVLLIGAGLLIKSFSRLMAVNAGFRTDGVLTFQATLTGGNSSSQKVNFIEQIVERLKALPGVQAAAATDSLPLTPFERISPAEIEGRPPIDFSKVKPGEVMPVSRPTVTLDYFDAMGIPVKSGRAFIPQDARPAAGVVIVNEAFANHHFPGESAVGKQIHLLGPSEGVPWLTVVGVVSDVRQSGLAGDVMPEVYTPVLENTGGALSFVIRAAGNPNHLISAVRAAVADVEPNQPLHNIMTMEQRLANTTTSRRLNTALLGGFAAVALLLAVVGIYGVMSFGVAQRRREIGVRMALGARKSDVLGLVLGGGLRLTVAGIATGLLGAFALTRYLSSQLHTVKATDPLTFLAVAAALSGVALLACWLPARRAAKVNPMVALRT